MHQFDHTNGPWWVFDFLRFHYVNNMFVSGKKSYLVRLRKVAKLVSWSFPEWKLILLINQVECSNQSNWTAFFLLLFLRRPGNGIFKVDYSKNGEPKANRAWIVLVINVVSIQVQFSSYTSYKMSVNGKRNLWFNTLVHWLANTAETGIRTI